MIPPLLTALIAWTLLLAATAQEASLSLDGTLDTPTQWTSNQELARRLLSPLTALRLEQALAAKGQNLRGQPLDFSKEQVAVYVPNQMPQDGYGLLVFVPPWQTAMVPRAWSEVLDRFGVMYVSAAHSGNSEVTLARRAPLAVAAAQTMIQRYPVNRDRVFVGGFSGGARVALRLALGYPDLFRGALLNAGSDRIGDAELPLPPRALFARFQGDTRLVYLTGEQDSVNLEKDRDSLQSMRAHCVSDIAVERMPGRGHAIADPASLALALDALGQRQERDEESLAKCRSALDAELAGQIRQAESWLADGRKDDAKDLLEDIDRSYGGLAAPESVDLYRRTGSAKVP